MVFVFDSLQKFCFGTKSNHNGEKFHSILDHLFEFICQENNCYREDSLKTYSMLIINFKTDHREVLKWENLSFMLRMWVFYRQ